MPKAQRQFDPNGSMGAKPASGWFQNVQLMKAEDEKHCFVAAARGPYLTLNQMEQLVQGLPPETSAWNHAECVLDDHILTVAMLRSALLRGVLARPTSPMAFYSWCQSTGCDLPEAFTAVLDMDDALGLPIPALPQAASWCPVPVMAPPLSQPQRSTKRGRPKTNLGHTEALIREGREVLAEAADRGGTLTRVQVAKALAKRAIAGGKSVQTITRILSGQLPLVAAAADARAARLSKKK